MPILWDPFSGMLGGFSPKPPPPPPPPADGGGPIWVWCKQVLTPEGVYGLSCCYTKTADAPLFGGYTLFSQMPSVAVAEANGFLGIQECATSGIGGGGGGGVVQPICYQMPDGSQVYIAVNEQPPPGAIPCPPKPPAGVPEACGPQVCPDPSLMGPNAAQDPSAAVQWIVASTSCEQIDNFANQFVSGGLFGTLQDAGWVSKDGYIPALKVLYDYARGIPFAGALICGIIAFVNLPVILLLKFFSGWLEQSAQTSGCKPGPMAILAFRRIVLTWVRRIIGAGTEREEYQIGLAENYICPTHVVGVTEANLARMRGEITVDQWRCWVRMNNVDEKAQEPVYQAGREMLPPFDYSRAWLRGYIDDNDYDGFLQERGMLKESDRDLTKRLTEFLPPVTDVLHFIVRSLGDPQTVQRFGLLEEFDLLYQGQLVKWGEAAGIKKETMEFYHAAHWVVPSPGQLFTMLQRLREDNLPEGTDAADWITESDDVNRALRENAFAPFWRPRLEAIAYNPISRRDLLQAFQRGIIDQEDFASRLRDLGYTAPNANVIAATYKARILEAIRRETWYKLYSESAVTRGQASAELSAGGYTSDLIEQALDRADQEADAATRVVCLKSVGRQFATGGLAPGEAEALLLQAGLDSAQVQRKLVQWSCEAKTRSKEVGAAILCKWYARGLISPTEISARLVRVGYSVQDATRIVAECIAETSEARLKARLRALRDEQLAEQRAKRTGAYVAKQSELAKAAVIKALTAQMKARQKGIIIQERLRISEARAALLAAEKASRALLRAESIEQRQEARIQVAAEAFATRAGLDAGAVVQWILQAWSDAMQAAGVDHDTALEAVLLAAHDKRATDQGTYLSLTQTATQAAEAIESAVSAPNTPASSNSGPA